MEDEIRVVSSDEFREDAGVSKKDLNPMHVNPAGGKKSEFTAAEFSVGLQASAMAMMGCLVFMRATSSHLSAVTWKADAPVQLRMLQTLTADSPSLTREYHFNQS